MKSLRCIIRWHCKHDEYVNFIEHKVTHDVNRKTVIEDLYRHFDWKCCLCKTTGEYDYPEM